MEAVVNRLEIGVRFATENHRFVSCSCSLSSSLGMEKINITFPTGVTMTLIQEDLKPGGKTLGLGSNRIFELGEDSWSRLAGNAYIGFQNGAALESTFKHPRSFYQLDERRIVIADTENDCLRLLDRTSEKTRTFSGVCEQHGGDDGDMWSARYANPVYVARDIKSLCYLIVLDVNSQYLWSDEDSEYYWDHQTVIRQVDSGTGYTTTNATVSRKLLYFTQDPLNFHLYATGDFRGIYKLPYNDMDNANMMPDSIPGSWFSERKQLIFIDTDTLLVTDKGLNKLLLYDITTGKSDSICDSGASNDICAPSGLETCNIPSPVSLYMSEGDLYVTSNAELYVIKCKLENDLG